MDYEDMIEDEEQPAEETPETEDDPVAIEEPRAKSPWKAFVLTGFIAALIGAAGGGYGAYAGIKATTPAPKVQPKANLAPIESQLKQLTDRVSAAERTAREASDRPISVSEPVDLSGLEDRLTALETAPSPEIDPEALKSLQAAQADGFKWPDISELETRISAFESQEKDISDLGDRLAALESEIETGQNAEPDIAVTDEKISDLESRLTALEDRPTIASPAASDAKTLAALTARLKTLEDRPAAPPSDAKKLAGLTARLKALENRPAPTPKVERVSILAFPKERMILAAENNVKGGLIKRTISHHVRVRSATDPFTLIDGIETDISEGNLTAAVKKFESLPSPVRSAGQAWYESVKASL